LPVEETTEYICHMYYTLGGFRNILIHWFMDPMGLTSDQCAMLLSKFYLANRSEKLCEVIREKKKDT